jgi:hypothetical protein
VGLKSLKSLTLTNGYPNNKNNKNNKNKKNNKVKSKPLELIELAGKNYILIRLAYAWARKLVSLVSFVSIKLYWTKQRYDLQR